MHALVLEAVNVYLPGNIGTYAIIARIYVMVCGPEYGVPVL